MARVLRLLTRAWHLRHDREALLNGLDRAGIRVVPGAGRYEMRSPRVGGLINAAWAGHVTRSLADLEQLASRRGREARDATLALSDWAISHGHALEAIDRLTSLSRLPRDGRVMLDEAQRLTSSRPLNPLREMNTRLTRSKFAPVSSNDGTITGLSAPSSAPLDGPLVSVIVPVYGCESSIALALTSLCRQTWRNLEMIVIDDGSSDRTAVAIEEVGDPRITLIRHSPNQSADAARNWGLASAKGEFVTVNDADDWAHPAKIATQVHHLLQHPDVVANTTALVRITDDLRVVRHGAPHGCFVGHNQASLMLRTSTLRSLGGWDAVWAGADSELEARLIHLFGKKSVVRLHDATPLAFARIDVSSINGNPATNLASSRSSTGALRLYTQSYTNWHRALTPMTGRLERSSGSQPFPCPSLIRHRSVTTDHVDVIMLSDLALPGGTTASNLSELTANERAGWRTGLVHNRNPKFRDIGLNPKYFAACSDLTRLLSAGEAVSCDVLTIKYPPSACRIPEVFPQIKVRHEIVMIANQTPWTGYTGQREQVYDIIQVNEEITSRFGRPPLWFPIGPTIRQVFERHHDTELPHIRWADDDWFEIIDVPAWKRSSRPDNGHLLRIGRHGRDSMWKWPNDPTVIKAAYPNVEPFMIDILGGAEHARKVLGKLPSNWHVRPFDSISPFDYLAQLDVFVHFAHPDMEEGFGRTILEALATGVPVITEPRFARPFGDAVIVSEPRDVVSHLSLLQHDPDLYSEMVRRGLELAESHFGFAVQHRRVEALRR